EVRVADTVVTPSPGFISIAVTDIEQSAAFYEGQLGAVRDTFDFGPGALAYVGWPTCAINATHGRTRADLAADSSPIQLWWRASGARAALERVAGGEAP